MFNKDCIFCKIANKKISAYILAQNKNAIALLDVNPISNGHCLIISKKHYCDFEHTPVNVLTDMCKLAKIIIKKLNNSKLKPSGFNYLSNQGAVAQQAIFHVHLHIIPKYNSDAGLLLKHGKTKIHDIKKIFAILSN